jgi:hypothetical protein
MRMDGHELEVMSGTHDDSHRDAADQADDRKENEGNVDLRHMVLRDLITLVPLNSGDPTKQLQSEYS